jgi:hypothetical protein
MKATLATRIMAHPSRAEWAEEIAAETGAVIVWDEVNHPWDTRKRAMIDGAESGASHVCILQDDIILSEGLVGVLTEIVQHSTFHPVGIYSGDSPQTRAAMRYDPDPWWAGTGPIWGPGSIVPAVDIPEIIAFGDRMRIFADDIRIWHYYRREKVWCWYTVPSLIQHRTGHGSLVGSRKRDRQALRFGSGVGLDWSKEPMVLDEKRLHPRVQMVKDGRVKIERRDTRGYKIAEAAGFVEVSPGPQ